MYPYDIFPGFGFYELFFSLALAFALILFRVCSDKLHLETRVFNFTVIDGVITIAAGYFSAVLFQAIYNYADSGVFEINSSTGMTFYGGFIGGAFVFLSIYFCAGAIIFKDKLHLRRILLVTDIGSCSVAAAHATGRIGCLFDGCCYGARTDSFCGIMNVRLGYKTVPLQLFETIFLYALLAFMLYRLFKHKTNNLALYLAAYGIWRFALEYFRADERGAVPLEFFSPSQLTAVILTAVGAALYFIVKKAAPEGNGTPIDAAAETVGPDAAEASEADILGGGKDEKESEDENKRGNER